MEDEKTLKKIAHCWVEYRKVSHVQDLDEYCRYAICAFLLKIAEDDRDFVEDLELQEEVSYCNKYIGRVIVPGVI
jgi:uncharacterized protein YutD